MSESQAVISSLYLPMVDVKLLLPNVSVAEVVDYQDPKQVPGKADCFLGMVDWRGISVPVVSYEMANGASQSSVSGNSRIAVINTIGDGQELLPFFAIVTQGIPRLVKVSPDVIKTSRSKRGPADSAIVKVDGEEAAIPDIEFLESLVKENI